MRISGSVLIYSLLSLLLVSCSSEGEVLFNKETTIVKDNRLTAAHAVKRILKVADDDQKVSEVVRDIRKLADSKFDWEFFWARLDAAEESENLSEVSWNTIAGLHSLKCTETAYRSFANAVVNNGLDLNWLAGPKQRCARASLGKGLLEKAMRDGFLRFREGDTVVATALARVVHQEYRFGTAPNWEDSLEIFGDEQWNRLAHVLWAQGEADPLIRLSGVFFAVSGSDGVSVFQQALIDPIVTSEAFFDESLSTVRLDGILGFLGSVPEWKWGTFTKQDLNSFFNRVILAYEAEMGDVDVEISPSDQWEKRWRRWNRVRKLLAKNDNHLDLRDILLWAERILRGLEANLAEYPDQARYFLKDRWGSLDGRFLEARLAGRFGDDLNREPLLASGSFRLDRATWYRTEIKIAANPQRRAELQEAYCGFLTEEGVVLPSMSDLEFAANPSVLEEPGCVIVEVTHSEPTTIRSTHFKMAYDSVLIYPAASLTVETEVFDGSTIDMSRMSEISDYEEEVLSQIRDHDAVVVPILGCFLLKRDFEFELGMHQGYQCFVIHFPFQYADAGDLYPVELESGLDGGSLNLNLQYPELSNPPAWISLGGEGQLDARVDGRGSESSVDRDALDTWLVQVNINQESLNKPKYHLNPPTTIAVLNETMRVAEKDPSNGFDDEIGRSKFYINWQYTLPGAGILDRELLARFEYICGDLDRQECFRVRVRPRVETYLKDRIDQYPEDANTIIPEMNYVYSENAYQRTVRPRQRGATGQLGELTVQDLLGE